MAAPKKGQNCSGCGAEMKSGPARCPLCGTEPGADPAPRSWKRQPPKPPKDDYQASVRELREQLRKLRDGGAEAV